MLWSAASLLLLTLGQTALPPPAGVDASTPGDQAPAAAPPADPYAEFTTEELLFKAKSLFEDLDFPAVEPLTRSILSRPDISIDERLDASLLLGSSLAIIGDTGGAEKAFQFLLRGRPDYDMPSETSPKILALFRQMQLEERTTREHIRSLERRRIVEELEINATVPQNLVGGQPLTFDYRIRDARQSVAVASLHYRRGGEPAFSALALRLDELGRWHGELSGQWSSSLTDFSVEYYLTLNDRYGEVLTSVGTALEPRRVHIAAGVFSDSTPMYKLPWFWAAVGGVLVAGAVGTAFYVANATRLPESPGGTIDLNP